MNTFSQKHAQYAVSTKLKEQNAIQFEKKAIRKTESCKKQAQKARKFQLKQPKNKQPASLQKNPQLHKKTSPNSREKRNVANTASRCFSILRDNHPLGVTDI